MAYQNINFTSTGANQTIVPGSVTGLDGNLKRTRVSYLELVLGGACTVSVISGTTTLATYDITAAGGSILAEKKGEDTSGNKDIFTCNPGDAFILLVSADVTCQGYIRYVRR